MSCKGKFRKIKVLMRNLFVQVAYRLRLALARAASRADVYRLVGVGLSGFDGQDSLAAQTDLLY